MFSRRGVLAAGAVTSVMGSGYANAQTQSQRPYRILSIDGGGIKGIIPARILEYLERARQKYRKPSLVDSFDLFAGTSTGCIIAAALAGAGETPIDFSDPASIVNIYASQGGAIFEKHSGLRERLRKNPGDVWGQFYSSEGKRSLFKKNYGEIRLRSLRRNFVGTYYQMRPARPTAVFAFGGPAFNELAAKHIPAPAWLDRGWMQYAHLTLSEVVEASSSAPIYFNPAEFDDKLTVAVDGGVFANNPAAIAYSLARGVLGATDIEVVSIGCGTRGVEYPRRATWGVAEWITPGAGSIPLLELMADAQNTSIDHQMDLLLPEGKYHRFQAVMPTKVIRSDRDFRKLGGMDDPSPENIAVLLDAANMLIEQRRDELDGLAARL